MFPLEYRERDSDSDDSNYAQIPPPVPAPRGQPPITTTTSTLEKPGAQQNDVPGIANTGFLSGSIASLRYGPNPSFTNNSNEDYSEIDGASSGGDGRLRDRQRRPSDYEAVFVRNVGFVSTEDSHPLSPNRTSPDGGGGGRGEEVEEETFREAEGKIDVSDLPPLNPAVGNNYEIVGNQGFKEKGGDPTSDSKSSESATREKSPIEVIRNESYKDLSPPKLRAAAISTSSANNPMYSTSASSIDINPTRTASVSNNPMYSTVAGKISAERKKELKQEALSTGRLASNNSTSKTESEHKRVNGENEHQIPSSSSERVIANGGPPICKPGYAMYDIPPSNPREKPSEEGVKKNEQSTALTSINTYDIPPSRGSERVKEGYAMYDVPPSRNPFVEMNGSARVIRKEGSATYDVPPSCNPFKKTDSEESAKDSIPSSNPFSKTETERVKEGYAMYDIPPPTSSPALPLSSEEHYPIVVNGGQNTLEGRSGSSIIPRTNQTTPPE